MAGARVRDLGGSRSVRLKTSCVGAKLDELTVRGVVLVRSLQVRSKIDPGSRQSCAEGFCGHGDIRLQLRCGDLCERPQFMEQFAPDLAKRHGRTSSSDRGLSHPLVSLRIIDVQRERCTESGGADPVCFCSAKCLRTQIDESRRDFCCL